MLGRTEIPPQCREACASGSLDLDDVRADRRPRHLRLDGPCRAGKRGHRPGTDLASTSPHGSPWRPWPRIIPTCAASHRSRWSRITRNVGPRSASAGRSALALLVGIRW